MGMAASQARLLAITARIHDVEFQAQTIQAKKLSLATQSDAIYEDYLNALEKQSVTHNGTNTYNGSTSVPQIATNFNNFVKSQKDKAFGNNEGYYLTNKNGQIVVDDQLAQLLDNFKGNIGDSHAFAMHAMGMDSYLTDNKFPSSAKDRIKFMDAQDGDKNCTLVQDYNRLADTLTKNNAGNDPFDLEKIQTTINSIKTTKTDADGNSVVDQEAKTRKEALATAYAECESLKKNIEGLSEESVMAYIRGANNQFDSNTFNYYQEMAELIATSGNGYIAFSKVEGVGSNAASAAVNGDWFTESIQNGTLAMGRYTTDDDYNNNISNFENIVFGADTTFNTSNSSDLDSTELARAEAEYERKLKAIDAKDKRYDMELSKLETERQALTTEYDSLKKVISDNIERTFGIFS